MNGNIATPALAEQDVSMESLLAVPLEFILSESRPLLKGDASALLRVQLITSEMDVLMNLITSTLGRRRESQRLHSQVLLCTSNENRLVRSIYMPGLYARAAIPMLSQHVIQTTRHLHNLEEAMRQCLQNLVACRESLQQCSEQNLAVAEQLSSWSMGPSVAGNTRTLASEKRLIGEVEEAVLTRIDALIQLCSDDSHDDAWDVFVREGELESMADLVLRLESLSELIDDEISTRNNIDGDQNVKTSEDCIAPISCSTHSQEMNKDGFQPASRGNEKHLNEVDRVRCVADSSQISVVEALNALQKTNDKTIATMDFLQDVNEKKCVTNSNDYEVALSPGRNKVIDVVKSIEEAPLQEYTGGSREKRPRVADSDEESDNACSKFSHPVSQQLNIGGTSQDAAAATLIGMATPQHSNKRQKYT